HHTVDGLHSNLATLNGRVAVDFILHVRGHLRVRALRLASTTRQQSNSYRQDQKRIKALRMSHSYSSTNSKLVNTPIAELSLSPASDFVDLNSTDAADIGTHHGFDARILSKVL